MSQSSAEKIYLSVLKRKSAKEKIKLADGLFEFAKRVNPEYFRKQTERWIWQMKHQRAVR